MKIWYTVHHWNKLRACINQWREKITTAKKLTTTFSDADFKSKCWRPQFRDRYFLNFDLQKISSFSWNVFALAFVFQLDVDADGVSCRGFIWDLDRPWILLARFILRSNESACFVYMVNPADDTTIPAIINIAIVLSFSLVVGAVVTLCDPLLFVLFMDTIPLSRVFDSSLAVTLSPLPIDYTGSYDIM